MEYKPYELNDEELEMDKCSEKNSWFENWYCEFDSLDLEDKLELLLKDER